MKPVKIVLFTISLSACSTFPADTLESFDSEENQTAFLSPMPNFTEEEHEALFGDYFRLHDDNSAKEAEQLDQSPFVHFIPDFTPEEREDFFASHSQLQDDSPPEMPEHIDQTPDLSRKRNRASKVTKEFSDEQRISDFRRWVCRTCEQNFRTRDLLREHAQKAGHYRTSIQEVERKNAKKARDR